MQIVYAVNFITVCFIVDALINIYCGIHSKKTFLLNAYDMILHVFASLVFIGILGMQDLVNLSKFRVDIVTKPMSSTVFYLLCIASFVSQVCLIRTLVSHCESFKLVIEEEAHFQKIVARHQAASISSAEIVRSQSASSSDNEHLHENA